MSSQLCGYIVSSRNESNRIVDVRTFMKRFKMFDLSSNSQMNIRGN